MQNKYISLFYLQNSSGFITIFSNRAKLSTRKNKLTGDACYEWTSGKNSAGYGCITIDKVQYLAHRLSYYIANKEFDQSLLVLHKCDNRKCVRPSHLYQGTYADNNRDTFDRNDITRLFCKKGHELDEYNTLVRKNGNRLCKKCCKASRRLRYLKQKNEVKNET